MGLKEHYDSVVRLCHRAARGTPQWLGRYITPEGPVDLYVTRDRPENFTEHAERLKMPLPPRV